MWKLWQFASNDKFLALNNEAILTYWSLKNTVFTFSKCDSATFTLLNCLGRISLRSYKIRLKNWIKIIKTRTFFISPKRVNIIIEAGMFFLILSNCYSFYIKSPWFNICYWTDVVKWFSKTDLPPGLKLPWLPGLNKNGFCAPFGRKNFGGKIWSNLLLNWSEMRK